MAPPKLRHQLNSVLTPGERISSVNVRGTGEKKVLVAGNGTYVRQVRDDVRELRDVWSWSA